MLKLIIARKEKGERRGRQIFIDISVMVEIFPYKISFAPHNLSRKKFLYLKDEQNQSTGFSFHPLMSNVL